MRVLILILLVAAHSVAQEKAFSPTPDMLQASEAITTGGLMSHIRFLADDLLEGRGTGTRGEMLTRAYIASQMERMGLQPGGENGTYFQKVVIKGMRTDNSATMNLEHKGRVTSLQFGEEFVAFPGVQQPQVTMFNAELVFVGYGIVAPEQDWDDYKGVDIKGKVLLMLNNDPAPDDPRVFSGKARTYYGRWTYKYEIAAKKGAAGAIIIHTDESAGYGWNVVQNSWSGERFELQTVPGSPTVPVKGWVTSDAANRLLALAGKRLDALTGPAQSKQFTPVPLGISVSIVLNTAIREVETANVIGVLPGSDPSLKEEAVIYTAHHDHFGIGRPVEGDSIYNGARDNATGVSAVLNIAGAFTTLKTPQRRSIVFMTVAAEEQGLIGSKLYSKSPTFTPGKIAANINIDGLPIYGKTRDIIMIGWGKSSIDGLLTSVARWQQREVKPDQSPEKGLFYRSDQFNFAKIGVPCMFLKSGLEYIDKPPEFGKMMDEEYTRLHYHQPSDEVRDSWDLSGAVDDTRLNFLVGLLIADNTDMPVWNKGDEFESARLRALGK